MRGFLFCAVIAALPALLPAQVQAQQESGITRAQADEILDELRQIRALLEKQQGSAAKPPQPEDEGPRKAKLSLQGAPSLGSKDAPLTMVEYTDLQCPFCERFHTATFQELKKNYIDTGKLRFFSRDLPLNFHPNAMQAALAGRCAGEQGQFWQMRDLMAANPTKLDMASLLEHAKSLKMDTAALQSCIESGKYKEAVQTDVMEAMKVGADGTPAFVVGKSTPDGVDGELVVGALPYEMFVDKLKEIGGEGN